MRWMTFISTSRLAAWKWANQLCANGCMVEDMASYRPGGLHRIAEAVAWYPRRLSAMAPQELIWRSSRAAHDMVGDRRVAGHVELRPDSDWPHAFASFRTAGDRPVFLDRDRACRIAAEHPEQVSHVLGAADRAADLTFRFFGYPAVSLQQPIDWNHDPLSNVHWPSLSSARINHRRSSADVKWIWELNRLQHLPLLAEAWLFTGDPRYSAAALDQLDSWIHQNPPGYGIAWRGAFEVGLRSVAVAVALQGLRDAPQFSPERFHRFAGLLAESAHRCWRGRSLFSSANNHLIGEMAALAIVAMMLPELRHAERWERRAVRVLCAESGDQILADGAGAEQSVGYQTFTVELLNLVAVLLAQRDGRVPPAIAAAITRSSSFLSQVVGSIDPDPRYGDDDGGFALRLNDQPHRTVREHLGIMAASGWPVPALATHPSLDAAWFRSVSHVARSHAEIAIEDGDLIAPHGGLVVLRSGGRRVTMDIGPLGYLAIAAHGHADALAVTMSLDGDEVISDPGTGSYYGHPDWRSAMRGTRAHATVCVDDQNQSVIGGPFLWSRHARVTVRGLDRADGVVDAEHDGYAHFPGSVIHRRWLVAPPGERWALVLDLITGDGRHRCVQTWPLHPDLEIETITGGHLLSRRGVPLMRLHYAATAQFGIDGVRGDEVNNLGWWSDQLESRRPAWWLRSTCDSGLPVLMAALLSPIDEVRTHSLTATLGGGRLRATWFAGDRLRTATADVVAGAAVHLTGDS